MDSFGDLAGAYVHTPFCSAVCPYCDFAVVAGKDDMVDRYCAALVSEVEADEAWRTLDAVYFGGGTPSRVPPALLRSVLESLRNLHGIATDAEITLEANPEDWSFDLASGLRSSGFNRVSFGAQSFDSSVLLSLGRRHGPEHIVTSVRVARRAGFDNVSLDLIYGTPGETDKSWLETVEAASRAEPDHVSCYALTVEPGTELGRQVRRGAAAPDPDEQANRFEVADGVLSKAGLSRYEVSNWARPGRECRYNSLVWAQGEYVAYGNGAHGFRDGMRSRNVRRLETYLERIESGSSPLAGADHLEGWDLEIDRLFVGLRRRVGVRVGPGAKALLDDPMGRRLVDAGVIEVHEGRLRVVDPMLTDEVLRAVVGLDRGIQALEPNTLKVTNA